MKIAVQALALFFCGALSWGRAATVTVPADWSSRRLANVNETTGTNEVYFWPGDGAEANILSTGGEGNWLKQEGGPIDWTPSALQGDLTTRSGEFFPNLAQGSVLMNFSSGSVNAIIFNGSVVTQTLVASELTSVRAFSCTSDSAGNLHAAFGCTRNGVDCIAYAQKPSGGGWTVFYRNSGYPVYGTAVAASSLTTVKVFFNFSGSATLTALAYCSLSGSALSVQTTVDGGGLGPIATIGSHLYYCRLGDATGGTYLVRDLNTSTLTATTLGTLPRTSPSTRGIRAALGPDGKVRVAIFESATGIIYYMKAEDGSFGQVADLTGTLTNADLRGFMFTASGVPCVLYRKTATESYVLFPKDEDDADGNGRSDLADTAFRSSTGGVTMPPIAAAIDGVTNSAGFFKIQFPVVGSPTGTAGVLKNTAQNLSYTVQVSTNMTSWTVAATGLKFTLTGATNAKTANAVFSDAVPGSNPRRFARVIVGRIDNPF